MSFRILYHPEVYNDIRNAVDWYNKQQPGLGVRFTTSLKQHLNLLKNSGSLFTIRYDDIHCMPIRKFPFMVHYRVDKPHKTIKIEAVFNTNLDPHIWMERKEA